MARPTNQFQIEEFTFALTALPPLESADLLPTVFEVLPAIMAAKAASESNPIASLAATRRVFSQLRPIIEAFRPHCKVANAPGTPPTLSLGEQSIFDEAFYRRQEVVLEWAMRCIQEEYGDFLTKGFPDQKPKESDSSSSSQTKPTATGG